MWSSYSRDRDQAKAFFVDKSWREEFFLQGFKILSVAEASILWDTWITYVIDDDFLAAVIAELHTKIVISLDGISSEWHNLLSFKPSWVSKAANLINGNANEIILVVHASVEFLEGKRQMAAGWCWKLLQHIWDLFCRRTIGNTGHLLVEVFAGLFL